MRRTLLMMLAAVWLAPALALGAAGCVDAQTTTTETVAGHAAVTSTAGSGTTSSSAAGSATTATTGETTAAASTPLSASYDAEDLDATWDSSTASLITLAGDSIRFDGAGATVDGSTVTITSPGTYLVTGTLSDGKIRVASDNGGTIRLVLKGADISCSTNAPIYVINAGKTVITLVEGTENRITDGASYGQEDTQSGQPNAAIFSADDLTINGSGSLSVKANYNDGITSTDDLKIAGGTISVDAANDAIKGKDSIGVKAGTIAVTAGGDGLQATNDVDAKKGYISIESGTFDISSGTDAIQAQTTLAIGGGEFTISTGGGSANSSKTNGGSTSAKGLKAAGGIFVTAGTFAIDSSDDSIHSGGTVKIDGGTIKLASGDDGIHADSTLEINGGQIDLTQSYEGLESAVMTINGGTIHITSSDDGINVAGGVDGSSVNGRPGQNAFAANPDNQLYVNGGYIVVDAQGDAVDCNGPIYMTNGTIIANGPTRNDNGALDYGDEFKVTGGHVVAVGSSGMAEVPSDTSSVYSIMVNFDQAQQAGTLVHIESTNGEDILTVAPTKQFQSVVLTSSAIKEGATYKVYLGGSSTGTVTDSVYSGGTYTPGTEYVSLTIEGVVTTSGATGGMGPGGGPGGGGTPSGR
jgi:hypothetical protein